MEPTPTLISASHRTARTEHAAEAAEGRCPACGAPRGMLSRRDLAARLGVSVGSVDRWLAEGPESGKFPLPVYRIGGQDRWEPADVEAFILQTRRWP